MLIKKGWISSVEIKYDLDGWTGRYGMPLEFLVAVHSATLMPDLAYDMATTFDTNVRILLKETSKNDIIANYKNEDGVMISKPDIDAVMDSGLFSGLSFTKEESARIINLGVIPPDHGEGKCECEFDTEGKVIKACDACHNYIKAVSAVMNDNTTTGFSTYSPYIESVRNHWFRDVYFVVPANSELSLVKTDYDYENLMKERWTKYQMWGEDESEILPDERLRGFYKLYKVEIDKDGKYTEAEDPETNIDVYMGYENTRNQGDDVKVKYVKRAETVNLSEDYEDLYWTKSGSGNKAIYMAYSTDTNSSSSMEKMFDGDNIAKESDPLKKIAKGHIYANLTMKTVKQTGDGLRSTTNEKIKQMFLTNRYFRYDGTKERAEEITQLREEHDLPYGVLKEEDLDKSTTYIDRDGNSHTVKVEEVSGAVQITQDSLNAFSMLENTHTLDADFIYRDFKELIVELGFFTKEELMEAIPQVMAFPVAEIGTYGYPFRVLDKREQEKGSTLIHSEKDYKAYTALSLGIMRDVQEGEEFEFDSYDAGDVDVDSTGMLDPNSVGAIGGDLEGESSLDVENTVGDTASFTLNISCTAEEFLEYAAQVHAVMENSEWGYCNARDDHGPSNGHTVHGVYSTQEEAAAGRKTVDCSTYVCWVLQAAEIVPKGWRTNSEGLINTPEFQPYMIPRDEAGEPQPGDILLMTTHGKNGHAQINGEDNVQYNCGGTDAIRSKPKKSRSFIDKNASGHYYEYILRLFDNKKKKAKPYEGYKGNEAVVSPVTGVLLEYGRYDDESLITTTMNTQEGVVEKVNQELRENVDMKYPTISPLVEGEIDEANNEVSSQRTEDTVIEDPVIDKVGYAKILVLDGKHLAKLVQGSGTWPIDKLVKFNDEYGKETYFDSLLQKSDDAKTWDAKQKTVYGFKEFAENYYKYGVAGFTVYIDGFVCELPEEIPEENGKKPSTKDNYKTFFHGKELTFDDFKAQSIGSLSKNKDSSSKMKSEYIDEDKHQFASKSFTEKVSAENQMKKTAAEAVTNNGFVFIKEGTVLGRTMSDIEANSVEINGHPNRKNNDPTHDFKYYRPKYEKNGTSGDDDLEWVEDHYEYDGDRIIGNYLRVTMLDTNGEVVENVEDYMKLDPMVLPESSIEKLMTWQALEPEGFHFYGIPGLRGGKDNNVTQKGHICVRENKTDKYGYEWTICDGSAGDPNLCPGIFMGWPGQHDKYSGGKIFHEVTGIPYSDYVMYDTWCTGTQLFEIYTKELEAEVEGIKHQIEKFGGDGDAIIEAMNQDQINALIDVSYAGVHYMTGEATIKKAPFMNHKCKAELIKKVAAGRFNEVTVDDFVDTNPNHPRRRIADYIMFKEGVYMQHVNNCSYNDRFLAKNIASENWNTCYEYISETPFQDLMRRVKPVEEDAEWGGSYPFPEILK